VILWLCVSPRQSEKRHLNNAFDAIRPCQSSVRPKGHLQKIVELPIDGKNQSADALPSPIAESRHLSEME
jgi:hypothetical protein